MVFDGDDSHRKTFVTFEYTIADRALRGMR